MRCALIAGMCGVLVFFSAGAWAADSVKVEDLKGPERVEAFLELGIPHVFSHNSLLEWGEEKEEAAPFDLTLKEAITLAKKTRLEGLLGKEKIEEAQGRNRQAWAGLLPQLSGEVSQTRTFKQNLEAQGMRGYGVIGPFNTFDARIRLVQKVIDVAAAAAARAGGAQVNVARYEEELTRQKIELISSLLYLDALRAQGAFQAADAGVVLSERLLQRAKARKTSGVAAGIDVVRSETRLAEDQLALERSRTGLHDAYLDLQRAANLPYDQPISLVDSLCFIRERVPDTESALAEAKGKRIDMRIAGERVRAARYAFTRARGERLPVVVASANYGVSAIQPKTSDRRTSGISVAAQMPFFAGGRIFGEEREARSLLRQAELMRDDLTRQVEEDVRKALWTMTDAMTRVDAAARVVELARREMDLSEHRFTEGVASHIEVASAQTSLAQARDGYIEALAQYHAARINLYFALGKPEAFFLEGANAAQEAHVTKE